MRTSNNNTEAVSTVIGVILMVAIVVLMAAVIAAITFGLGGDLQKTPVAAIMVQNNPDTTDADFKIVHRAGDTLRGGAWRLSIVPAGRARAFIGPESTSELRAGDQFLATNTTIGASNLTSMGFEGGEPLSRGTRYDVTIIEHPSKVLLFEAVVEVR